MSGIRSTGSSWRALRARAQACRSDPAVTLPACRIRGNAYSEGSRSRPAPSPTPTGPPASFGSVVSRGCSRLGVLAGYWRKRDSAAAAELVQHRYRLSKVRDLLLRGDEVKLWKVTDIADFLGVSTQRVHQLALAGRFPAPSRPLGPRTLLGAIGRRGLGGGQVVGRGWPSLATQAIGERGISLLEASGSTGSSRLALARRASWRGTGSASSTAGPQTFSSSERPVLSSLR